MEDARCDVRRMMQELQEAGCQKGEVSKRSVRRGVRLGVKERKCKCKAESVVLRWLKRKSTRS